MLGATITAARVVSVRWCMVGIRKASADRLYSIWVNMRNRCYNPNAASYPNYGQVGVRICDDWYWSFGKFAEWAACNGYDGNAEVGECTLDRIDPFDDYKPENCRWVSSIEQNGNRRVDALHSGNDDLLFTSEVAAFLDKGTNWTLRRLRDGTIPSMKIGETYLVSKYVLMRMKKFLLRKQEHDKTITPKGTYVRRDGKVSRQHHEWTEEEDKMLLSSVGKSSSEVAKSLDVNQSSVIQRVNKLGYKWSEIKEGKALDDVLVSSIVGDGWEPPKDMQLWENQDDASL